MPIDRTKYLSEKQIILLHEFIMDLFAPPGNIRGVKDYNGLRSLVKGIRQPWYEDIYHKAAYMFQIIGHDHIFHDGNKRTATFCVDTFLGLNGYTLKVPNQKLENLAIRIAEGKLTTQKIRRILLKYTELHSSQKRVIKAFLRGLE
jgi:death-on-curing family protein